MSRTTVLAVAALAAGTLIACTPPDEVDDTVSIVGTLWRFPTIDDPLYPGRVCWVDQDEVEVCTDTDQEGEYRLEGLAPDSAGTLFITGEGIVPAATPMALGDIGVRYVFSLDTPQTLAAMYAQAGVESLDGTGTLSVEVGSGFAHLSGATVTLEPDRGSDAYFLGGSGATFDLAATATTDRGGAYFLNVPVAEGPYEVSVTAPGGEPCSMGVGVAVELDLHVYDQSVTNTYFRCDPG